MPPSDGSFVTQHSPNAGQSTGVRISTDPAELDVQWVVAALSERAYWAQGRPRDVIEVDRQGRINLSRKAAMQRHLAKEPVEA